MPNELYTLIVSGEKLVLTKEQMESDPGNYFATYFFGGFQEGSTGGRELAVEKDVQLFKLIQAHLRGYRILPLADAAIPTYMTREVALINLFLEAQYYGLQQLEDRIKSHQPNIADMAAETPLKLSEKPLVRAYKLAMKVTNTVWSISAIPPEVYQALLSSFAHSTGKTLLLNQNPHFPGFSTVLSWSESPNRHEVIYAILSNS